MCANANAPPLPQCSTISELPAEMSALQHVPTKRLRTRSTCSQLDVSAAKVDFQMLAAMLRHVVIRPLGTRHETLRHAYTRPCPRRRRHTVCRLKLPHSATAPESVPQECAALLRSVQHTSARRVAHQEGSSRQLCHCLGVRNPYPQRFPRELLQAEGHSGSQ